ncbi:MAG TPA: high-potential iron-sulfur protein [Woeseiaceae bacterium]|nr:high-potential iron-sulfur protein [Woeseiaceae bacterium]
MTEQKSRRRFLKLAVAASTLPLLEKIAREPAYADLPLLTVDNPQATGLSYVEDATTSGHALYKAGNNCSNCQLFTAETGACSLFPGFAVAPEGWCAAWMKRA